MKNRLFKSLLCAGLCTAFISSQSAVVAQVGIGTNAPSSNSLLDVTSATKGIMLPRIDDTTSVSGPSAGLMIYDKQAKTPAYHDGTQWNLMQPLSNLGSGSGLAGGDSVTYTITGATAGNGFTNGTYPALNANSDAILSLVVGGGGTGSGQSEFKDVTFQKSLDINTTGFARSLAVGSSVGSIELKFYVPGSSTPYFSVKAAQVFITSFSVTTNGSDHNFVEKIGMHGTSIGYKNWITGAGFLYNTSSGQIGTY